MPDLLRVLIGPLLWALHFSFLYAIHTGICLINIPHSDRASAMLATTTLFTIGALAILACFFVWLWGRAFLQRMPKERTTSAFLDDASLLLIVLSAAGILWVGVAGGFVGACEALR